MEKRIDWERRGRKPNQIKELNLGNYRSKSIVGLSDEYTALETLSLVDVGLTTLEGFPKLPELKKLDLSYNSISDGLNYLHTSPKLLYLNLSDNKITDLVALEPLKDFKKLFFLDLFNNEITKIENYRKKIFEMLPTLRILNGLDSDEEEGPTYFEYIASQEYMVKQRGKNIFVDDDDEDDDIIEGTPLSYIYNDNIEDDEDEEWKSSSTDSSDDDDLESDEDDINESVDDANDVSHEETQPVEKKRKRED